MHCTNIIPEIVENFNFVAEILIIQGIDVVTQLGDVDKATIPDLEFENCVKLLGTLSDKNQLQFNIFTGAETCKKIWNSVDYTPDHTINFLCRKKNMAAVVSSC